MKETARKQTRLGIVTSFVLFSLLASIPAQATALNKECANLNNEGVTALKLGDSQQAINKFKAALKTRPDYSLALENLGIAYNNLGIANSQDSRTCLRFFHMSVWFNPKNVAAEGNLEVTIENLGKKANSFADRVALANAALKDGDFAGAIVEFKAAQKLQPCADLQKKIDAIVIPEEWQPAATGLGHIPAGNKVQSTNMPVAHNCNSEIPPEYTAFTKRLQAKVKSLWNPPRAQQSESVLMAWKVNPDGSFTNVHVKQSSGVMAVDEAAIAATWKSSPMVPPASTKEAIDIEFTFQYNVNLASK